jgi:glycosyltransferase involved in cell wall biosynthesis
MRVLVVSNLFPGSAEPQRGLFNFEQMRALSALDEVRVVCPSPEVPGAGFARRLSGRPQVRQETHMGIRVDYPRYPYLPRVGQRVHDRLFEHGIRGVVAKAVAENRPGVMVATWSYPDVVAASRLARAHGLPLVAKVHGTDVNDYFKMPRRRRLIVDALRSARAVVAVSNALADCIRAAGVDARRVHVIPNGVDTARFAPRDRGEARARLGVAGDAPVVLFVGNLKPVKGIETLIRAFAAVAKTRPDAELVVAGAGPLGARLQALAERHGLGGSARFLGGRTPDAIAAWMNAASVLCLPSLSEGMPNVLLEAGASGLPVVASRVGGIPEVVHEGITGLLVAPSDPAALAGAIETALARAWDAARVRAAAGPVSWDENAARLHAVLASAAGEQGTS